MGLFDDYLNGPAPPPNPYGDPIPLAETNFYENDGLGNLGGDPVYNPAETTYAITQADIDNGVGLPLGTVMNVHTNQPMWSPSTSGGSTPVGSNFNPVTVGGVGLDGVSIHPGSGAILDDRNINLQAELQDDRQAFELQMSLFSSLDAELGRQLDRELAMMQINAINERSALDHQLNIELQNERLLHDANQSALDRASASSNAAAGHAATMASAAMSAASREAVASMQIRAAAAEGAAERALRQALQDDSQEFTTGENLLDRELRREIQALDIAESRRAEEEKIKAERQRLFVDMIGRDPVRAVLLALGISGPLLPEGEIYENLEPLQGATQLQANTETALSNLTGNEVAIGQTGVSGLGPLEATATTFQQGGVDIQNLLSSAFGVGNLQGAAGISPTAVAQRIGDVTPTGALGF